jgi:hypothetical protein
MRQKLFTLSRYGREEQHLDASLLTMHTAQYRT